MEIVGNRYELLARIGKGGVGEVFRARDRESGREVAVKILRALHRGNDEVRARFEREARLLELIRSPHVCELLDFSASDETPYLVCALLEGKGLDAILRGGRALPLAEVGQLVDDILAGLTAAHAAGVVHRDLKPSNVVVEARDGRHHAVLVDFGVSKLLPANDMATLTTASATLGSPQYMAPEQFGGSKNVDARCDVYAAATIAFRALTGRLPFAHDNTPMLAALKRTYPPETLAQATGRAWPDALQIFFDVALATDPAARPPSAANAAAGWRRAVAAASSEGGAPTSREAPDGSDDREDDETPVLSRTPRGRL
ncbi:MAG TPA: serine/threonine-protein kinase [Labilithrix sp.]